MKRILSMLITLSMILSLAPHVVAEEIHDTTVTLIVEVSGKPMLEMSNELDIEASLFSETEGGENSLSSILSVQESVQSDISKAKTADSDVLFTYTDVFNGFAIKANISDIERIKALPNVKNVYISKVYEDIPQPVDEQASLMSEGAGTDSCCDMMNVDYMHDNGIKGEGSVIAIIDNEFDVNHEFFSQMPKNPRYSKDNISDIISKGINAEAAADNVYRNEKVPYAYNYSNKSADVFSNDSSASHGTHVAGIAAGAGGVLPDGTTFDGVAPEAQIIFMAVPTLDEANLLAALDDAAKFDVDALNFSIAYPYMSHNEIFQKSFSNLINSGVSVSVAAGNIGRGFYQNDVPVDMVDYSSGGMPCGFSNVTAVAAANSSHVWESCYTMQVGGEALYFIEGNASCSFANAFCNSDTEYVYCGTSQSFDEYDLTGKIAVVERTSVKSAVLFPLLINAGAVGAVFVNNVDNRNIAVSAFNNFPTAIVSLSDGEKFKNAEVKTLKTVNEKVTVSSPTNTGGILSQSSWCTSDTLELKPELSAPGSNIYSSVPNNKYALKNGTSMATPHSAGAMMLMGEYILKNSSENGKFVNYNTKQLRQQLAEKLLMTAASVQTQNDIPFSPRMQGAGIIDLEAAANTPVVLTVNGGKPKISLKDKLSDKFTLTFEAYNFSDSDVTYTPTVITETDDYTQKNGINYVGATKLLTSSASTNPITIASGETKTISLEVQLDSAELDAQSEIFTNGFFIDGFVSLTSDDENVPKIGLPFTGFYGDWLTAEPLFDKPYYEDGAVLGRTFLGSSEKCIYKYDASNIITDQCAPLGKNLFSNLPQLNSHQYGGISPNGDGMQDYVCVSVVPLRNGGKTVYSIKDADGNVVLSLEGDSVVKFTTQCADFSTFDDIPDGDYTAEVTSSLLYEGAENQSVSMNFYIDREAPVVLSTALYECDGEQYLDVVSYDNRQLMGANIYGLDKDGNKFDEVLPYDASEVGVVTFNVTDLDLSTARIDICDYAMNIGGTSGINISYSDAVTDGNKTTMDFTISNVDTDSDTECDIVVALYDADGSLSGISTKRNDVIAQGISNKRFEFNTADYASAKMFVWESLESMSPICYVAEFELDMFDAAIDYSSANSWAYYETDVDKDVDVFIVAPTVYGGNRGNNMAISETKTKANMLGALNMERGIYDEKCRMFSPYYRQIGLKTYTLEDKEELEIALENAYYDVKEAFLYYFEHENNGRPFILAGFSQGSDMTLRLMKDLFGDEKYTKNLIANYAIGWSYTEDDTAQYPWLKPAQGEDDTGVIIAFNSEAESVTSSMMIPEGTKTYAINPLNWKTDSTPADKELNKGACFTDYSAEITQEIPNLTGAYIDSTRGALKVTDVTPEQYPAQINIFEDGIYHIYDYQFFYRNLQENVKKRIDAFLNSNN